MENGAPDPNNAEAVSIVFRYVKGGIVTEKDSEMNAQYLTKLISSTFKENNISLSVL